MHEHVVHRLLERVGVDALRHRQVALRVHVDAQHAMPLLGEGDGEVERRRRLGDAALLVGEGDDLGLAGHGRLRSGRGALPSRGRIRMGGARFLPAELSWPAHGGPARQAPALRHRQGRRRQVDGRRRARAARGAARAAHDRRRGRRPGPRRAARSAGEAGGFEELELGRGLFTISIDPEHALEEYLRDQLPARAMADLLASSRMFQYFAAATPGMRELLTIGKVWELAQLERRTRGRRALRPRDRRRAGHRPRPRGAARARAPSPQVARVGPIARQAGIIDARDRRPPPHRRRRGRPGRGDAGQRDARAARRAARAPGLALALTCRQRRAPRPLLGPPGHRDPPRAARRDARRRARAALRAALSGHARARGQREQLERLRDGLRAEPVRAAVRVRRRRLERAGVRALADALDAGVRVAAERPRDAGGQARSRSAAARAAWARRRPRRRSRWAWPREGARVAVVTIDPARRLANSLGLEELGNEPRLVDPKRFAGAGLEMKGELWAMMLDPKRTFDELIDRLAPDDERARRGPRQPHLPGAVERGRRLAGVHGDRQALRARPRGRLRPARARHAALAQRARLPRRARPPHRLLRGPRAAGLPAARRASGCARRPRHGRRVRGAQARHRRRPAEDLSVFFRSLGGLIDGFKERAERGQRAARRPGHDVPARHLARARADRGGDLLLAQAQGGADAVRRRDRQPRAPRRPAATLDADDVARELEPELGEKLADARGREPRPTTTCSPAATARTSRAWPSSSAARTA